MVYNIRSQLALTHPEWRHVLNGLLTEDMSSKIDCYISLDLEKEFEVYPPPGQVFEAFKYFGPGDLKVVIVGQDCYHGPGEAHGLCFSVPDGVKTPPSLRNVFKELEREYGVKRASANLTDWAQQGVLLLNRALTVRQASPNSHKKIWHTFTEHVIRWISTHCNGVVFMLWGNDARALKDWVDLTKHHVLEHTHPSPLSRAPFAGNGHFEQCNRILGDARRINWL